GSSLFCGLVVETFGFLPKRDIHLPPEPEPKLVNELAVSPEAFRVRPLQLEAQPPGQHLSRTIIFCNFCNKLPCAELFEELTDNKTTSSSSNAPASHR